MWVNIDTIGKVETMSPSKNGKRAAIYVRVSTVKQGEDGGGLEAQLKECRQYATALGMSVVIEEHDMVSGRKLDERDGLDRIIRAGKAGKFDVLVVREVSRFARRAKDALQVSEDLTTAGIEVTDIKGQSSANKLLFTILSAIAEYEADLIRERAVGGRVVAASHGKWIGGSAPFGYKVGDDGRLEVEPDEAETIRAIFNMAVQPEKFPSSLSIAKELRRRGIGPRLRDWGDRDTTDMFGHSHVQTYLQDGIYRGDGRNVKVGGESFLLPAPAIVDSDVWEAARKIVVRRQRDTYKNGSKRDYALSGRIVHLEDDGSRHTMFGELKVRKGKYATEIRLYRCLGARETVVAGPVVNGKQMPGISACSGTQTSGPLRTTVRADDIEARVLGWALGHLRDPDLFASTITAHQHALVGAREDALAREDLVKRLDAIPGKRDRWVEQYGEGLIDKATRDAKLADLNAEEVDLQREIANIERDASVTPAQLLAEMMEMDIEAFEPDPGEFDPTDAEWSDVESYLWDVVTEYAETGDPLPALAQRWVAHVVEVLDLHLIVTDRDRIEHDWVGSRNGA